jgi:hypothetical protein
MTPVVFLFICVVGIIVVPYGMAKMRGKVYGFPRESESLRLKRELIARIKNEQKHRNNLNARKLIPVINIWQSDFQNGNPNNYEFCRNLNETWFHRIRNSGQKMDLSKDDLQKIKEMYLQEVYTPNNFPITWRDVVTWRDVDENTLQLQDISEEDIKKYYFRRCPQPMVTIEDVISFIGTVLGALGALGGVALIAAICGA